MYRTLKASPLNNPRVHASAPGAFMRGNVHPEWVPQHSAIHYLLLGHLFKVHIPMWFVPGVFATLKPPVTERRRLQRLFYHPEVFYYQRDYTLFCFAGQVICWGFIINVIIRMVRACSRKSVKVKCELTKLFFARKCYVGRRLNETSLRRVQRANKRLIKVIRFWGFKVIRLFSVQASVQI